MRRIAAIGALFLLASCQSAAYPPRPPTPPPAAPKLTITGNEGPGEMTLKIYHHCRALSKQQCSAPTQRCDAYERAFVKGCMIKAGVPPDYVAVMIY